jgi:hypothetical protein
MRVEATAVMSSPSPGLASPQSFLRCARCPAALSSLAIVARRATASHGKEYRRARLGLCEENYSGEAGEHSSTFNFANSLRALTTCFEILKTRGSTGPPSNPITLERHSAASERWSCASVSSLRSGMNTRSGGASKSGNQSFS